MSKFALGSSRSEENVSPFRDFPSLEMSSDSYDDEDTCESSKRDADDDHFDRYQRLTMKKTKDHRVYLPRNGGNIIDLFSQHPNEIITKKCCTSTPTHRMSNYVSPSKKSSPKELLAAAAKYHFGNDSKNKARSGRSTSPAEFQRNAPYETRSCFSSPGKTNFTLREKLSRLTRAQRKDLLMKPGSPQRPEIPKKQTQVKRGKSLDAVQEESDDEHDPEGMDRYQPFAPRTHNNASGFVDGPGLLRMRMMRHSHYNGPQSVTPAPLPPSSLRITKNHIILNIYDLIPRDTLMQLPWGCMCEIGKCFNDVNSALHQLGTGAYHVGVEINGTEYSYGAATAPGRTGVFSCIPRLSPGYQYRTSIDFGERALIRTSWVTIDSSCESQYLKGSSSLTASTSPSSAVYQQVEECIDGRVVMQEMATEYMGVDYDILRKNCCTFARDACLRLGIPDEEIPTWFRNLAESGAMTQDVANATLEPLTRVLSSACDNSRLSGQTEFYLTNHAATESERGFEVIAKRGDDNQSDVLVVMDERTGWEGDVDDVLAYYQFHQQHQSVSMRRTITWTY